MVLLDYFLKPLFIGVFCLSNYDILFWASPFLKVWCNVFEGDYMAKNRGIFRGVF